MGEPTLRDLTAPNLAQTPLCITEEALGDGENPLKPGFIQYLPIFEGHRNEDPNKFLVEFYTVCSCINQNTTPMEQLMLRAFPFSLGGEAKDWFHYLPRGPINTRESMKRLC